MTGYNPFDFNNSAFFKAIEQFQRTIDAMKAPMDGITAAVQAYRDAVVPMTATLQNINNLYAPILEQTRKYEELYNNSMIAALQSSASAMKAMAGLDLSAIQSIVDALPKYDFLSDSILKHIDFDAVAEMYDEGKITDEDIAEEFQEIVAKKEFSFVETWDNVKKSKWFLAIRWLLVILMFFGSPVVDKVKENTLEVLGVNDYWEESGVYEWLDNLFGIENGTVSEQEAKESIDDVKTGNTSKQKREDLLEKIKEIRTFISAAPQDENTGNLLSYLSELETDISSKKYGLIFEEHREDIDEVLDSYTPVLSENSSLFINNGGKMNYLIEGDNFASLRLLEKTHKSKIDLIYIDPPYNTGNKDFIYDDAFVDKNDTFSHSKWLSFISRRLKVAKKLLSDNGVIFISIDDNEEASLKLLCDTIFGENCFVANISWQRTYSIRNDSKGIPLEVEHILVYSKKEFWQPNKLPRTEKMDASYSNPDGDRCAWMSGSPIASDAKTHQGMVYAIQHPLTGKLLYPNNTAHWRYSQEQMLEYMNGWCEYKLEDLNDAEKRAEICGVSVSEVRKGVKAIVLSKSFEESYPIAKAVYDNGPWPRFYFTSGGKGGIRRKVYADSVGGRISTNYWAYDEVGHTDEAKKELKAIFDGVIPFDTPKPVRLLERIIQIASNNDSIILDFFAGSGSTGHAVMNYNATNENSNRRFILCTNNENNICRDVTYERIKRIIDKEKYVASMKYYKVNYVPISERFYYEYADELLLHIRELVELENGLNFTGNTEIAIILTEEELNEFINNIEKYQECKKIYLGHDILMDAMQSQVLKENRIAINIIPDYYYKDLEG